MMGENLGNVRPEKVKRIARELVQKYADKFTTDFEENKRIIESIARIPSTKLRNRIVGYITRLMVITHSAKQSQTG